MVGRRLCPRLRGAGLLATRGTLPDFISIDIANALVLLGYGLTWAGARAFDGRKMRPFVIALAPALWLLACRVPGFGTHINLRIAVGSTMLAIMAVMTRANSGAAAMSR